MNDIERYLVIPRKYIDQLRLDKRLLLQSIIDEIQNMRLNENKDIDPSYIVCKQNEPYAEQIWDLILKHNISNDIDDQMLVASSLELDNTVEELDDIDK